MTTVLQARYPSSATPAPTFTTYHFTYRFEGAEWSIAIPAQSLQEAKERVKVLGFARYEGEAGSSARRTSGRRGSGWFRRALQSP
ncbi:MAG: hypothetical protein KDJ86_19635 [Bauldia sp.]|uniref:hypothetical protein n=1 Tax=Bauldia sp. TaxID=2575872 RepID=UPI001DB262F6|nr:hypothetical protein [Bauldia sp.]MCB1498006.1 hypothetical protein [Bauldia sp.]